MQEFVNDERFVSDQRLERIETKLSFAEDLLEELNRLVFRQQEQIASLQTQLSRLLERGEQSSTAAPRDPRDERPPHY